MSKTEKYPLDKEVKRIARETKTRNKYAGHGERKHTRQLLRGIRLEPRDELR